MPFHNYAGPGTHVIERLQNSKPPTTILDKAALIHDIDYMNPNITKQQADITMYNNLKQHNKVLAIITKGALFLGNRLGKKNSNYKEYLLAKELAYANGFIDPTMNFT